MKEYQYSEDLKSNLTTALFIILALVFLGLFVWRYTVVGWVFLTGLFLFMGAFFIFYIFNYRTLQIRCSDRALILHFGLVHWKTEFGNIQAARLDDPPLWIKYGGAGVHFAMVEGNYRAFFNFLEYPRVLVTFQDKRGPVEQLCFTTRQPDQILDLLQKESDIHGG